MNIVSGILRQATRKHGEVLNILTCPTHEAFETGLAKTGHNFWALRAGGIKDWNRSYRPLPCNYTLLNPEKGDQQLPPEIDFDVVISQQKFGQFQILSKFAQKFQIPLISLEHTQPLPNWSATRLSQLKSMKGDVNVFISEFSREAWGWKEDEAIVIHHGIDTGIFQPIPYTSTFRSLNDLRKPVILSVVNDWINRDVFCGFKIWQEATAGLPVLPIGDTPGLSKPAKSIDELSELYATSQIFINTSLVSPIPTALLEAMSSGCACVTTATSMIPSIIKHGENGLMSNNPIELKKYCQLLLSDEKLRRKLGEAARQTIIDRFSSGVFVKNWNNLLRNTCDSFWIYGKKLSLPGIIQ